MPCVCVRILTSFRCITTSRFDLTSDGIENRVPALPLLPLRVSRQEFLFALEIGMLRDQPL
jgi:hypothetical protein